MFIDHIHQMFWNMGVPEWLNLFGRPVFPLFLFLAATSIYLHLSATAGQIGALICLLLSSLLVVEGGTLYVLLGLLLYIFREKRLAQIAIVLIYAVVYYLLEGGLEWAIALAAIPMLFYNGQKGRGMKKFFYLFYPIHIIGLYLLATLVF